MASKKKLENLVEIGLTGQPVKVYVNASHQERAEPSILVFGIIAKVVKHQSEDGKTDAVIYHVAPVNRALDATTIKKYLEINSVHLTHDPHYFMRVHGGMHYIPITKYEKHEILEKKRWQNEQYMNLYLERCENELAL